MYQRCISILSCSKTKPGICFQTRPIISLCSLSGLSLQGKGPFLAPFIQSKQDRESLSAIYLDCLCQAGLTPWSVNFPVWQDHSVNPASLLNHVSRSCWGPTTDNLVRARKSSLKKSEELPWTGDRRNFASMYTWYVFRSLFAPVLFTTVSTHCHCLSFLSTAAW